MAGSEGCIYHNYSYAVRQSLMENVAFEHALENVGKIWTSKVMKCDFWGRG